MSNLRELPPFPLLQFYTTAAYNCSYLPERQARSQVATPTHLIDEDTYDQLVRLGFRRSGIFTYRPWCNSCHACLPLRVLVNQFQPNRCQKRVMKRHENLVVSEQPLLFFEEHYDLYQRYQAKRHGGGGMDKDNREQYSHFLLQSQVRTKLLEFREDNILRMVSLVDVLSDGLSSVYTFFDPDISRASYGVYSVLWQLELCRELNLPHLYLGYWIANSNKMRYKDNYRPHQTYQFGAWVSSTS